jgi:hypothetical protein
MALFALISCGGAKKESPLVDALPAAQTTEDHGPHPQVSQELGSIDPRAADRAFQAVTSQLQGCQKSGLKRMDYLAGEVKFFVRLDANGKVHWSYVEGSTLGDRATEKCMLDVLATAPWPRPEGGEAEVRKGFVFDAGDSREPTPWGVDKIQAALSKSDADIQKCKSGVSGTFHATAYVEPEGKAGKIEGVGIAPPNKDGEGKVDCLVGVIQSMKVPSPGSYAAKVSFDL